MNNFVKKCYYNESNQESIIMYKDYFKTKKIVREGKCIGLTAYGPVRIFIRACLAVSFPILKDIDNAYRFNQ
jgi:hypothetical protein